MKETTCKVCGQTFPTVYGLTKHKQANNHFTRKRPSSSEPLSVQVRIQNAEKLIQDAIRDIEIEQRQLQERILALDDLKAKYKHH